MNIKYNRNIKANYLEERDGDIKESICDNSKIKKLLNITEFKRFEKEVIKL